MSDRVTNVEIEDVLSSIRRLVSEAAPIHRAVAPDEAATQRPAPPVGKLLLTEAHRVASPENPRNPPADAAALRGADVPDALPASGSPNDLLGESGILLDLPFAFRNRSQPSVGADHPAHDTPDGPAGDIAPDDGAIAPVPSADIAADLAEMAEHDLPDDGSDGDDVPAMMDVQASTDDLPDGIDLRSIDPGQRLSDTVAGLEMATQRAADDWEPDGSEGVPVMDWAAATEQAEDGPVPIFRSRKPPPLRLSPDLAVPPEPVAQAPAPASAQTEPAVAQGAAVLPFQSERRRAAEGGGQGDLTRDLDALDPADRASADDASDAAILAALRDANGLNDALLRDLVLEIVRQELQGALGERITRNVRKLVRREIYRVLNEAEQD